MSKTVKTIASIALPIVGNIIAPGIGGMIGGAIGGAISGGVPGAVLGAVGGYASGGATNAIIGSPASLAPAGGIGPVTQGSGIWGALTGGGLKALGAGAAQAVGGAASNPLTGITSIGNMLMANEGADAAKEAAGIQANSASQAAALQAPYQKLGTDAVNKISEIQADPGKYIANNPFYGGLAKDAERRLLANEAARGKVGSGGTAKALQDQLLLLGNGLVNSEITRLQGQAGMGQGSATVAGQFGTGAGDAAASGVVGANNAYQTGFNNQVGTAAYGGGYQNQLSTLLALQNLNKAPSYSPTGTIYM